MKSMLSETIKNDTDLFVSISEIFVGSYQSRLKKIALAFEEQDSQALYEQIHTLKNTVGTLGTETPAFKAYRTLSMRLKQDGLYEGE